MKMRRPLNLMTVILVMLVTKGTLRGTKQKKFCYLCFLIASMTFLLITFTITAHAMTFFDSEEAFLLSAPIVSTETFNEYTVDGGILPFNFNGTIYDDYIVDPRLWVISPLESLGWGDSYSYDFNAFLSASIEEEGHYFSFGTDNYVNAFGFFLFHPYDEQTIGGLINIDVIEKDGQISTYVHDQDDQWLFFGFISDVGISQIKVYNSTEDGILDTNFAYDNISRSEIIPRDFDIVNLTADFNQDSIAATSAGSPSLNDKGHVAYQVYMVLWEWGGYSDVYLDGLPWSNLYKSIQESRPFSKVNITVNAANYTTLHNSGQASLNNKGQLAWRQAGEGIVDIYLNGVNITADIEGIPEKISLNNRGQVVWQQDSHIFLDGTDLGIGSSPSLNDHGQVAWVQSGNIVLDGVVVVEGVAALGAPSLNNKGQIAWLSWFSPSSEWDVFLDGVNLTENISGTTGNPFLNDHGQVAWVQRNEGLGKWDIYLDGVNITYDITGDCQNPSLNNKGQVAFVCDGDVYLATPIR
jgi:hypothetical protein